MSVPQIATAVTSDDFDRNNLDVGLWEFVNPLGDGTVRVTGVGSADAHLELSVPNGPSHDPWNVNRAPRVMQPTTDDDFTIEVAFASEPGVPFQMQGIVVEQDAANWMRFDCYHDGSALRAYAAATVAGSSSARLSTVVASGSAHFLRVRREGNEWTFERSGDGASWSGVGAFSHSLTVTAVGWFVANHGTSGASPAFTASADFFFDGETPVVPEDGAVAPDVWPPLIHAITHSSEPGAAHVSWFTDEPALGTVEYGTTTAYELGAVSDFGDSYDHEVLLDGLVPGAEYHVRILSEDALGHGAATDDLVFVFDPNGPTVDVWYGSEQSFGQHGHSQPWVNILGNVSDPDGVADLSYSLNGGASIDLTIGPDGRRLVSSGDFNVDLAGVDLVEGPNAVEITAIDALSNVSTETVTVNWQGGTVWPFPYTVSWSALASDDEIQNVAQVVDGKWTLSDGAIRAVEPGYDRLVAIGDTTWTDYEVTVPITLNSTASGHGVGILFRWNGHTDFPVVCPQPKCGYLPLGGILWYRPGHLEVYGNDGAILDTQARTLTVGTTYWFKGRVETTASGGLYRLRVWEVGQPEPTGWDVTGQADLGDPSYGSAMLITHLADVSFGDVEVVEVPPPANLPPVANDDVAFVAPSDTVLVRVLANDFDVDGSLDSTTVTIGASPTHGSIAVDPVTGTIAYAHDGSAAGNDSLTYSVRDDDGDLSNEATVFLTITDDPIPRIESDDFNRCVLGSPWTFESPLGDGSHALVGGGSGDAWLSLDLPAGTPHDAWGAGGQNEAVRVMQNAPDGDFVIEAHWKTEPTGGFNDQGILVEQDANDWLRFDVYHNNAVLKLFVGKTIGGTNTSLLNATIPSGSAQFLRVTRTAQTWVVSTSGDGANYDVRTQFTQAMNVARVGVYAANPVDGLAWTSAVDWFFDIADPIALEDQGTLSLLVTIQGGGSVQTTPDLPTYECDDVVELTASPDPGWVFGGWAGDLGGTNNPESLTILGESQVTALFVPDPTNVSVLAAAPRAFRLLDAQPNPFSSATKIAFELPRDVAVDVAIYDVTGRLVRTLLRHEAAAAGSRIVVWDGRMASGKPAAAGVYFCTVRAGDDAATGRLLRIR